jgi:hypothetical protein
MPVTSSGFNIFRDSIKVVPQNIMYDRRIVRGNTNAALVIPVSKFGFSFVELSFRFIANALTDGEHSTHDAKAQRTETTKAYGRTRPFPQDCKNIFSNPKPV